jgi:hypothetical protein
MPRRKQPRFYWRGGHIGPIGVRSQPITGNGCAGCLRVFGVVFLVLLPIALIVEVIKLIASAFH